MTVDSAYPPLHEVLAQTGEMVLLDRIEHHSARQTVCVATPKIAPWLLEPDGSAPAWLSMEYMAQCVAVHGNLEARRKNEQIQMGLLLGSRRMQFAMPFLESHREHRICVRPLRIGKLAVFDCDVRHDAHGDVLARGRLNVFRSPNLEPPGQGSSE
jgi:predicted hotdog family 3-hydroxylacyl-ACP dehydratase